jgi:glutamine---fructose-6-phosphate transaminase (isomerizing)
MCGIVGAVAQRNIVPVLVEGLRRLEYRGYDSCGVAVHADGALRRARSVSRVAELDAQTVSLPGFTGIAHTRWATHGAPTTDNAHPHFSAGPAARQGRIALVHNGIIENYEELRRKLIAAGYVFDSQTDTEVIAHLIDQLYEGDLFDAVQRAVRCCTAPTRSPCSAATSRTAWSARARARRWWWAWAAARTSWPRTRWRWPAPPTASSTSKKATSSTCSSARVWIVDRDGRAGRAARHAPWPVYSNAVELGPYRHFMQKEIFEQPRALADTIDDITEISPLLFGEAAARCCRGWTAC